MVDVFQEYFPVEVVGQFVSQRGFAGANVADDCNVHERGAEKNGAPKIGNPNEPNATLPRP